MTDSVLKKQSSITILNLFFPSKKKTKFGTFDDFLVPEGGVETHIPQYVFRLTMMKSYY